MVICIGDQHAAHVCDGCPQALGVAVLSFVAYFAVLSRCLTEGDDTSGTGGGAAGEAGLGLSYALPIIGALAGLISAFTETEKEMI